MTFDDVISRLLVADDGSEELDADIVALLNHAVVRRYPPTDDYGPKNRWQFWSSDGHHFLGNEGQLRFKVYQYTTSLDRAMSLIPKGWIIPNGNGLCQATLDGCWHWNIALSKLNGFGWVSTDWQRGELPKTAPLAVCIAALRARDHDVEA